MHSIYKSANINSQGASPNASFVLYSVPDDPDMRCSVNRQCLHVITAVSSVQMAPFPFQTHHTTPADCQVP